MESKRETTIITTPVGNVDIELKTYLTAREKRATNAELLKDADIKGTGKDAGLSGITGSVLEKYEDAQIKAVVVKVGESVDNIIKTMLDMPQKDYNFILDSVRAIVEDKDITEKKTD
jgi:hypothetical protein